VLLVADEFAVVEFTTPATAITFDITSPKLTGTVKAGIFFVTNTGTDDSDVPMGIMGVGMHADDGVDVPTNPQGAISSRITGARTTTQLTRQAQHNTAVISVLEDGSTSTGQSVICTHSAYIAGGVRLEATDVSGGQVKGFAVLFAGTARASVDSAAFSGTQATETTGGSTPFTPDLVVFAGGDGSFGGPSVGNTARVNLGFLSASGVKGHSCVWPNNVDPSDADGYVGSGVYPSSDSTATAQLSTLSIVTDGFQHQLTSGSGTPNPKYLALKFTDDIQISIQNLTAPGSTGAQAFSTGFKPLVAMGMSSLMTSEDTATDGATASVAGYFAFDDTQQRAQTIRSEEGLSITNPPVTATDTRQGDYGLLTYEHEGTVAQQATRTLTMSGFSLNFSAATAGLFTTLALGPADIKAVHDEAEGVTEACQLTIGRMRDTTDAEGISEACNTVLADGLSPLGMHGMTRQNWAEAGVTQQADIKVEAASVGSSSSVAGTTTHPDIIVQAGTVYG
jgi:hypothetical protein